MVYSPEFGSRFLQNVSMTVDYFSIELEDVIDSVPATTIITRCFNAEGANPTYDINNEWCQLFNRDQANGRVIDLQTLERNQSVWEVSGIEDRKSTRLNSSHVKISYAVFCLKKKTSTDLD